MLAMLRDAHHGTLRLEGDKAKPSVLRAVDLVSWQVHVHDIPEVLEVVLCKQYFLSQLYLTLKVCSDTDYRAAGWQHTCIHHAHEWEGLSTLTSFSVVSLLSLPTKMRGPERGSRLLLTLLYPPCDLASGLHCPSGPLHKEQTAEPVYLMADTIPSHSTHHLQFSCSTPAILDDLGNYSIYSIWKPATWTIEALLAHVAQNAGADWAHPGFGSQADRPVGWALGRGHAGQDAPVDNAVHQLRRVHVARQQPGNLCIAKAACSCHGAARLGR